MPVRAHIGRPQDRLNAYHETDKFDNVLLVLALLARVSPPRTGGEKLTHFGMNELHGLPTTQYDVPLEPQMFGSTSVLAPPT